MTFFYFCVSQQDSLQMHHKYVQVIIFAHMGLRPGEVGAGLWNCCELPGKSRVWAKMQGIIES